MSCLVFEKFSISGCAATATALDRPIEDADFVHRRGGVTPPVLL